MAEIARKVYRPEEPDIPGAAGSLRTKDPLVADSDRDRVYGPTLVRQDGLADGKATELLWSTTQSVGSLFRQAWERGDDACRNLSSSVGKLTGRLQGRAQRIKEDQPLRLVAVVACTALALGIVTRVWRSSRHG